MLSYSAISIFPLPLRQITYMLDGNQVRPDEWDVIDLSEHLDHSAVVNTRDEHSEKIREQGGLFFEVERKRLVVAEQGCVSITQDPQQGCTYISMLATRTMTSLNWLCSHASAERSIIARAALSCEKVRNW